MNFWRHNCRGILVVFATIFASSCEASQLPGESPQNGIEQRILSVDKLRTVFKNGSHAEVVEALNNVKRQQDQKELVDFIKELWMMTGVNLTDIPPERLRNNVVRLNIADVLIQASANGYGSIDTADMRQYARSMIGSDHKDEAIAAASALSHASDLEDIDALARGLSDPRDAVFRTTALSLAFNCNEDSRKELGNYAANAADSARVAFIDEVLVDRKKLCAN